MDGKYEKAKSQTQNKQCDKLVGTQATRNKPKIHKMAQSETVERSMECPTSQITEQIAIRRLAAKISPNDTVHDAAKFAISSTCPR